MKKLMAILMVMLLICGISVVASAEITAPEGYTVTPLFDFTAIPDGTSTAGEVGFWTADDTASYAEVVVEGGKVTFSLNTWGAFPNLNEEQQELTKNATGWGFYVNGGEYGGTISMPFNMPNGQQALMEDEKPIMFVALDGTITTDYSVIGSYAHGGFFVPEEFEGYVYIPFSNYAGYDGSGMVTPIYAIDPDIDTITFGEFFVYSSDLEIEVNTPEPTPEPTPEVTEAPTADAATDAPTDTPSEPAAPAPANNGWILWAAIGAVVVVVVVVIIIVAGKKKKD